MIRKCFDKVIIFNGYYRREGFLLLHRCDWRYLIFFSLTLGNALKASYFLRTIFSFLPVFILTQNHCSSNSCPQRHRCQTGFTDKGYRCVATNKTSGETGNIPVDSDDEGDHDNDDDDDDEGDHDNDDDDDDEGDHDNDDDDDDDDDDNGD